MPATLVSLCIPLVPFKLLPPCWSSEGMSRWVHVWVPQEDLLRAPTASSTDSIPTGFHSKKLWGLIFLALESWAEGPGMGLGLLTPKIPLLNFYPHGCGAKLFWVHAPPTKSGWLWFLQFHSCQTSIQLNFWCSWMMVVLYFSCNFGVVVWRGDHVCLLKFSLNESNPKGCMVSL